MHSVTIPEHRYTVEEYERLEEPDDYRSELIGGLIVREPPPSFPHGLSQSLLATALTRFVQDRDLGLVATEVGVVIDEENATVLGPDLIFISRDRVPRPLPQGFLRLAPDLVVEVVSPSNSASAIHEKVLLYLDAGTRLVWVVDPRSRTATVYRSRHDIEIVGENELLDGGAVLPGLELPLSSVLPPP